jgi:hypothetical protein
MSTDALKKLTGICNQFKVTIASPQTVYKESPVRRRRKLGRAELYRRYVIARLQEKRADIVLDDRGKKERRDIGGAIDMIENIDTNDLRASIRSSKMHRRSK